jgi:hypothetical protein
MASSRRRTARGSASPASSRTVTDGPFAEAKELVAGFWVWQVRSMEEAIEWVKRCPNPMPNEDSDIEIRPLFEAETSATRCRRNCAIARSSCSKKRPRATRPRQ